ncbi:GNAT family N-acetyltransferase [Fulvivirga sp. 29W222]|uniref:GNAT family N-acetyltransferase n=1 Tax=Fulvivirga marina TaxID=2494733 RepID=A0A937KAV8_9BACT|nr:GNAT family N-acetyltransferase [Fulvivirga marina]MBL6445142.1 GNAT family N-acetyltransferase [Fulvivirga marina]
MLNDFTIRGARPEDLGQVIALCYEHAAFEKAEISDQVQWADLSERLFQAKDVHCLVVEREKRVEGFATFMKQFSTWDAAYYIYLDCLYLKESARGHGLGQAVMKSIATLAKAQGCMWVQWQTPDFNKSAIRFYEKLGATSKSKKRFFWSVQAGG